MDNFHRQTAADESAARADTSNSISPPVAEGYHTDRMLGTGGSSSVWLVKDKRSGAVRALKVFSGYASGPLQDTEEYLAQLRRETAVLGSLEHPHLVSLHGVTTTDQGPGILTDYAPGGSLLNLVAARGRLSPGECITVLAPVAQALAHLHSAAIHHGDLSPGNVLFTAEGKPLIGDLGAARLLGEKNVGAVGTPGFSEALTGDGCPTAAASDVYSLAAVGWYSLTGNPPGPAKDRAPLTLLVPDVSLELLRVLEAGLHSDWAERPSAAEFAEAVLRSGAPRPLDLVAAVHPSVLPELLTRRTPESQPRASRRRRAAALARPRSGKPAARRRKRVRSAEPTRARRAQLQRRPRTKWESTVPQAAAAGLILLGSLLVGPHVLNEINIGSSNTGAERPTAENIQDEQAADSQLPALQGGNPRAEGAPVTPAPPSDLSAAMLERLSGSDPVLALSALVGVRAMALTTADSDLLRHVNISNSEAMDADQELMAGLQKRGHVFSGLSIRVEEATLTDALDVPDGSVTVRATVVMSGYTEVNGSGAAVRTVADATPQELVFVLTKPAESWKIGSVHAADAG